MYDKLKQELHESRKINLKIGITIPPKAIKPPKLSGIFKEPFRCFDDHHFRKHADCFKIENYEVDFAIVDQSGRQRQLSAA